MVAAIRRLDSCNGITEYFRRISVHFRAHGRPFDFLVGQLIRYPGTEPLLEELSGTAESFQTCRLGKERKSHSLAYFWLIARYCLAHLSKQVLLNTHSLDSLAMAAVLAIGLPKVRIIHTFHLTPDEKNIRFLNSVTGRALIRANARIQFLTISSEISTSLTKLCGIPPERIRNICHGVDTNVLRPPSLEEKTAARKQLGISDDRVCISVVARLDSIKGQDVLLKAMATIPEAAKRFCVVCVGSGDDQWLPSIARSYGLESMLKLPGHTDPLQALQASDFFVLPSKWEGFAMSCIEAMACGLPVIRTDTGGAVDQIEEGRNGFVVPVGDATLLAQRISELAGDEPLRKSMGSLARERAVTRFKLHAQLEETRLFFEAAAGGKT